MPKIYRPFTEHTSETLWAKFSLARAGRVSRDEQGLSLHMRLFLLGLGRVSNKGHAPFNKGEIRELMQRPEGLLFGEKHIGNQIKVLVKAGLLANPSNVGCLLYPKELIVLTTDKKNVAFCPEHGTHSSWSSLNNDWAPDYLPEVPKVESIVPQIPVGDDISEWHSDFSSVGDGTDGSY